MDDKYPDVGLQIEKTKVLSETIEEVLKKAIADFKGQFKG